MKVKVAIPLLLVSFFVITCNQPTSNTSQQKMRPNVIYILADDLGYGDLSVHNPMSAVQTPHMDRLAAEGMTFSDAHSASAVCTPTRYGILTGEYCWRSPLKNGVLWGYSPPLIKPAQITVASILTSHGYRTGVVGKWHLGLGWQKKDPAKPIEQYHWNHPYDSVLGSNVDFSQAVTGGPNDLGFEYSYIFPSSLDMTPYLYLENGLATEAVDDFTPGKTEQDDGRGVFWRPGEVPSDFDFYQVLDHLVAKGIDFIKSADRRPFFLYLPLTAPHTPWLPTEETIGTTSAGDYGDFVKLVDNKIGLLLSALDDLNIADNTLVVLSSDNGAHWTEKDKELFDHRPNFHFRGQKADIYEGGHRIPYLARWPGNIPAASESVELLSTTDFMATVTSLIGEKVPVGAGRDSFDQSEVLLGKNTPKSRDHMILHSIDGHFAIRKGNWKYTPLLGSGGFTQPVLIESPPGEPSGALYDLSIDIVETQNLIKHYPEQVQLLHSELEEITGNQF